MTGSTNHVDGVDGLDRVAVRRAGLDLLSTAPPVFGRQVHGYDRRQVDEHVLAVEREIEDRDRVIARLVRQLGDLAAERSALRDRLALSDHGRAAVDGLRRLGDILLLAAEDAAAVREEAERVAAEVRERARADAARSEALVQQLEVDALLLRRAAEQDRDIAAADRRAAAAHRKQAVDLLRRARAEAAALRAQVPAAPWVPGVQA